MSTSAVKGRRPPCTHEDPVRWWRSTFNNWICALCHPPAAPGLALEWVDVEGVSQTILKADGIDGRPGIPAPDLLAMWRALGRKQLESLEFKRVLGRLAYRWDPYEKRWHYVALAEQKGRA